MKIVILATEASGDFLASELIKSLKKKNRNIRISGVGGELMQAEGIKSWVSISEFNAIGIFEVIIRIFKFIKLINVIEKKIRKINPKIIITVDSPSFSYRLVKKLQDLRRNTKIIHYVAPTVWAWKSYRSKIFAKLYDQIFTLFKFEPPYFIKYGLDAQFVGHQIFFKKNIKFKKNSKFKKKKIITFLPGSRNIEIKNNMKKITSVILECEEKMKEFDIYILTFHHSVSTIRSFVKSKKIKLITAYNKKQSLMNESHLAVAASGSVTLELIKYKTPMVVFYDTHWLTKMVIKNFVKVKFASIINIFYNKEIIPELLFEKLKSDRLFNTIEMLTIDSKKRKNQLEYFSDFSKKMLVKGLNPSDLIVKKLKI